MDIKKELKQKIKRDRAFDVLDWTMGHAVYKPIAIPTNTRYSMNFRS